MQQRIMVLVLILLLGVFSPRAIEARRVHGFDCSLCHQTVSSSPVPYMTYNLCLSCHAPGNANTYELTDGGDSNPVTGTFASGDASDAMGSYPDGVTPGDQTSHFWAGSDDIWAGSDDIVAAAGAGSPADFLYNFGWSEGKITCSRCHDPHAAQSNPSLLRMGAGSTDAMCLDCHQDWNQTGNHGHGSHPLYADYPTLAAANPEKFRATPNNFGSNGGISLVDGVKVSCSSCHGVHFADSDASTVDGPTQTLSVGDGKLLKYDGPSRENPDHAPAGGADADSQDRRSRYCEPHLYQLSTAGQPGRHL
ncbi:MAG: cytochrome c3 family protein [Desulfuromonadaceae bacterium]